MYGVNCNLQIIRMAFNDKPSSRVTASLISCIFLYKIDKKSTFHIIKCIFVFNRPPTLRSEEALREEKD